MADSVNVRVSDSDKLYPNAVVVKVGTQEIIAGRDGVSPVVTTEAIPHGNRVTITDAVGEHAFDVMDGASAYEQAVAGGYEGTEEEFAEDLAGFSDKADTAETAAASAAQSAQDAADSASTATTKAGEAAASAAIALTHRDAADSSAQSAAASATSAGNSASAAAASASAANGSATSASASESDAANSATNAAASETAAAASESAAAASATAASNSAAAAAQSASAIEEYEHDAEAWAIGKRGGTDVDSSDATYQNNSKYYAEQAAASSSAASSAASEASQSATDAASEAASSKSYSRSSYISSTMASGSATAASEAQTAAETAAATAEGHATNAASSATAASGSATAAAQSATEAGNASTAATTAKEAAEDAQESAEALVQSIAQSAEQIAQNTSDIGDLKSAINDPVTGLDSKAPIIINSASGAIASFADGADDMPVKQLTVNVEPIQAGTGDPSPDNVRPISGRASATVTRTGVNVWDEDTELGKLDTNTGANGSSYPQLRTKNYVPIIGGKTYYFGTPTLTGSGQGMWILFYDYSKSVISGYTPPETVDKYQNAFRPQNKVMTVPSNAKYLRFYLTPEYGTTYVGNIFINYPSTDTSYHAYQGQTYTIQLGDTVYGGTLDVTQGKMVVTHMLFNRNSATMNNSNAYPGWNDAGLKALGYTGSRSGMNTLLNIGSEFSYNCDGNNDILFFGTGAYHKTQEEWKALALDIQIVIPLVTPIEITLTPTQIETLLGQNNIWSDAGPVDVDYRADTKLYIDNIHQPTEDDMTADAQIASGKYFLIGGNLYISTTVIPAGDTIIPGTNCIKTNLAEALNALNA